MKLHKKVKFGHKLAEARRKKKLTQTELAKVCGVNRMEVSRWENGLFMPNLESLMKLCKALDFYIYEI